MNYSDEEISNLVSLVPDEFGLHAACYFGEVNLDELWLWMFARKYPVEHKIFCGELDRIAANHKEKK